MRFRRQWLILTVYNTNRALSFESINLKRFSTVFGCRASNKQLLFIYFYIYQDLGTRRVPLSYTPYWCTRPSEVEIEQSALELGTTVCAEPPGFLQDFLRKAAKKPRKKKIWYFYFIGILLTCTVNQDSDLSRRKFFWNAIQSYTCWAVL